MPESDKNIQELESRLDALVRTQIDFQKEISSIRAEITRLRSARSASQADRSSESFYVPPEPPRPVPPKEPRAPQAKKPNSSYTPGSVPPRSTEYANEPVLSSATVSDDAFSRFVSNYTENARADLEKFIGENLISKVGIIVLVLGVGIGAKYAIDNNLISPLARIVVGYIFGFGLVGLAIRLRPKYLNFSAVLISGGMAIMYFVTYFAYSSYALISQLSAFALMAMFTVFTVAAALVYNRQVIAHIGLVGAYAVPFLLSNDSGNYLALFSYMSVVNTGILAISIKKYWKPLFYTSSGFTWAIFYSWFVTKYAAEQHFYLAIVFLAVFFAIFYATKLAQKMVNDETSERDKMENLISSLITGFIFFAFCLAISDAAVDYWTFFSYVAFASIAILVTSFRAYGRAFMYLVVPFVWLIYGAWFMDRYDRDQHLYLAVLFASLFFAIFYFSILVHRVAENNFTFIEHTSLILSNAFVFYGFGYSILDGHEALQNYLGLYTAGNAGLHLGVAHFVNKLRDEAVDVVQVLVILVLTFASIAIPVQFDGNFVTMIWSVEAALLFWFGRTRAIRLFEYFAYPVMVLATGSMFLDWASSYSYRTSTVGEFNPVTPLANGDFVTAIVFVATFAFIYVVNRDEQINPAIDKDLVRPFGYAIATLGAFVLYNMFRLEISNYFYLQKTLPIASNVVLDPHAALADIDRFDLVWQINYTMFFLSAMAAANLRRLGSNIVAFANSALASFILIFFATVSMFLFYELRLQYMSDIPDPVFTSRTMYIAVRYISYLFAAGLLFSLYRYSRAALLADHFPGESLSFLFDGIAYSVVFIVASCELVNLMGQFGIPDATKLGLSILWGVYALALIVVGIARDKKHLRIAAIVLLAVTLVKLFLYDIADLETVPKTILFITLGITLLVVSFLYNKYKDVIVKKDAASS